MNNPDSLSRVRANSSTRSLKTWSSSSTGGSNVIVAFQLFAMVAALVLGFVLGRIWELRREIQRDLSLRMSDSSFAAQGFARPMRDDRAQWFLALQERLRCRWVWIPVTGASRPCEMIGRNGCVRAGTDRLAPAGFGKCGRRVVERADAEGGSIPEV